MKRICTAIILSIAALASHAELSPTFKEAFITGTAAACEDTVSQNTKPGSTEAAYITQLCNCMASEAAHIMTDEQFQRDIVSGKSPLTEKQQGDIVNQCVGNMKKHPLMGS